MKKQRKTAERMSAIGQDSIAYIENRMTADELLENKRRVALIGAEIEMRGRKLKSDEEVECFVADYVEKQRQKGVDLLKEHVDAIYRIVRRETNAEKETNILIEKKLAIGTDILECVASLLDLVDF